MPFQYAIKRYIPREGISPEEVTYWNTMNSTIEFHPVDKHLAEADTEYGVVALFSNEGEQVGSWVRLDTETVEKAFNQKSPPASRFKDRLGSQIAVRDFVSFCEFDGTGLLVGQVAGFTAKNVRVINYQGRGGRVKMVDPKKLILIHPSIISE